MLWSEGEEDDEERMHGLVMDIGIHVVLWGKDLTQALKIDSIFFVFLFIFILSILYTVCGALGERPAQSGSRQEWSSHQSPVGYVQRMGGCRIWRSSPIRFRF